MNDCMRIKLDRTVCDGFGIWAKHAPGYFFLDDWGHASLIGDGTVPAADRDPVLRALMDCPVHTIMERGERRPRRRATAFAQRAAGGSGRPAEGRRERSSVGFYPMTGTTPCPAQRYRRAAGPNESH